eukprot:scaffold1089_cov131-Skeletonema_menzelii.AAC.9
MSTKSFCRKRYYLLAKVQGRKILPRSAADGYGKQIVIEAQDRNLGGFLKAGYPGVVCVEGDSDACDDFVVWIKGNKSRPGGFDRHRAAADKLRWLLASWAQYDQAQGTYLHHQYHEAPNPQPDGICP